MKICFATDARMLYSHGCTDLFEATDARIISNLDEFDFMDD